MYSVYPFVLLGKIEGKGFAGINTVAFVSLVQADFCVTGILSFRGLISMVD